MAPGKKKVRVANAEKVKNKTIKKQRATEGQSNARKKIEDARKRMADKQAKKADLESRAGKARTAKEKALLKEELEKVEMEIDQDDNEIKGAEADEERFRKEEEEVEKEKDYDEMEVDDHDIPKPSTEHSDSTESDATALITALLAGTSLGDPPVPLDISTGNGLGSHEKAVGYKNSVGGKACIVCNYEVKGWPIYRIRKDVVIGENVPNIMKDRRAGTVKDEATGTKWGWYDAVGVRGIAIAVPVGYTGDAEDLALPIEKKSAVEKEALRKDKQRVPQQPDVQVLIEWKEAVNGKVLSWESRATSTYLWKKAAARVLWDAAKHFEGYFREGGGEDVTPFGMPMFGRSVSPGDQLGKDPLDSTRTTPDGTPEPPGAPKPPSNSSTSTDKKAAARAEFKVDWCEEMGIVPEKMGEEERGSYMASFKVYWDKLNEKS